LRPISPNAFESPVNPTLKARLQADLNQARRDRDRVRTLVLSTTLSEVRNREIELGAEASDDDVLQVIGRAIKQRRDAAEQMAAGGRPELAEKEEREAELLGAYLPEQLGEDDVRGLVREIVEGGADQMGAVMGQLMPRIRGRFDGKEANRIVREELSA
jgi:hypothetical protein